MCDDNSMPLDCQDDQVTGFVTPGSGRYQDYANDTVLGLVFDSVSNFTQPRMTWEKSLNAELSGSGCLVDILERKFLDC